MNGNTLLKVLCTGPAVMALLATTPASAQENPSDLILDRPPLVTPKTEAAVEKAVRWLARAQKRDGSFSEGGGMGTYPCTMTALAGMAFLGHGDTPTRGRYAEAVRRAVRFLTDPRQVQRSGLISSPSERGRSMYGHGFSTMFLAQVLGEGSEPELEARIRRVLVNAIKLTSGSQSGPGGWLYTPDSRGDEGSVTVTQVQALRACRNAGVSVPRKVIKKAVKYIEKSMQSDGGIAYRIGSGGSQPAITAAATAVLYNAGEYDSKAALRCLEYCQRNIQVDAVGGGFGHWFYTHLYLSQAYWHVGGKTWNQYFPKIRDRLLGAQASDGSWQGDGVGRVYGTAIAVTILTLPYERVPLYMR
jgi:hypothetical protein